MTDIINEYFGKKGVRLLTYLTVILIAYAFLMVLLAVNTVPADFWIMQTQNWNGKDITVNMHNAFNFIYGQGMWIIVGSLTAFVVGQLVDVYTFHWLRSFTGSKKIWLRATGSTLISQLVDTVIVIVIAFKIGGPHWGWERVAAICIINYLFKFFSAIVMTPLIYLVHYWIDLYLGQRLSHNLIEAATKQK
jgi:uncharacterized integral membrane protein (TIGR00697 family)